MSDDYTFKAVIFDLDGVVTKTAKVHAAAWKIVFDEFLKKKAKEIGMDFDEFTYEDDYLGHVDGKPRYEGVASFLKTRDIKVPRGLPSDPITAETICGLGNRKNEVLREVLEKGEVEVYGSTIKLIKDLKKNSIRVGIASSSKNCQFVLKAAGIENYFETRVDGVVSEELGLKGKPKGDIFVKAAKDLGSLPDESIVVEDAVSGVQAGRDGAFGLVIGLARKGNSDELSKNGADIVLEDFEGIMTKQLDEWFRKYNK